MNKKYTSEHIEFFRENTPGRTYKELTALFNERFGTEYSISAITSACFRYGFKNGREGYEPTHFKKGHVPFNKGKKMSESMYAKCKNTMFKKGHIPKNHRPVGSERINADGYVEVKISEPNKWKMKHVVVWESVNGPISTGSVVIFADGNKQNIKPENLLLVSRKELFVLNQKGLISDNAELTKAGLVAANIHIKTAEKKKKLNKRKAGEKS